MNIPIRNYKGIFSNCDIEDLPVEYCQSLINFRCINARLVKTFGAGIYLPTAITNNDILGFFTFIHPKFTLTSGKIYVIWRKGASDELIVKYYDSTTAWTAISLPETVYHKNDYNPVLLNDMIMRLLPGAYTGANTAKGVWYGYIDRDYFDGLYSPSADFYVYTAPIPKPDFVGGISAALTTDFPIFKYTKQPFMKKDKQYWYKYSFIYDGIQESLLSNGHVYLKVGTNKEILAYVADDTLEFIYNHKITITTASHNKRITAIKVYRADNVNEVMDLWSLDDTSLKPSEDIGTYTVNRLFRHISTIDLMRKTADIKKGANSGYSGQFVAYIPALKDYTFEASKEYKLYVDQEIIDLVVYGGWINIVNPGAGTGKFLFTFDGAENTLKKDTWNSSRGGIFKLRHRDDSGGDLATGAQGCYSSSKIFIITGVNLGSSDAYVGGVVTLNYDYTKGATYRNRGVVTGNFYQEIELGGPFPSAVNVLWCEDNICLSTGILAQTCLTNASWYLTASHQTPFSCYTSGASTIIDYCDIGFPPEEEHYLANETSVDVNGQFAKIINGRMFLGNIVLDPAGTKEQHTDWVAYSEVGQYDVIPVSNIVRIDDREGGAITGIQELFGNVVALKNQAIMIIYGTKEHWDDPALWVTRESGHNLGNIAARGSITAKGALYVVYHDGIYRLYPNNLAESDSTPLQQLRISEAIGDIYNQLTTAQKQAIKCEYDQNTSEILYCWTRVTTQEIWAFNVDRNEWRQIQPSVSTIALFGLDENANVVAFDATDTKIHSFSTSESVNVKYKKLFRAGTERPEIIRYATVIYKSSAALVMNLYLERSGTVAKTITLPIATEVTSLKVYLGECAKVFEIEVTEAASSSTGVEIYTIMIHD